MFGVRIICNFIVYDLCCIDFEAEKDSDAAIDN